MMILISMLLLSLAHAQPGGGGGPGGGEASLGTTSTACSTTDGDTCAYDGSSNFVQRSLSYNVDMRISGTLITNQCPSGPYGTVMGVLAPAVSTATCVEVTLPQAEMVSTSPIAAPLRGTLALSVAGGVLVYGPMEAGFTLGQACNNGLGSCQAGLDVPTCSDKLLLECGADEVNYGFLLDTCGGHAQPYHIHADLACDYAADQKGDHSALIAVGLDGRGVYGLWEGNGVAPTDLDACGGHFGPTPAYTADGVSLPAQTNIYHYHTQEKAPYTLGCFGPTTDIDECKSLYSDCGDDQTLISTSKGDLLYDLDCPCYGDQNGATYNVYSTNGTTGSTTVPTSTEPSTSSAAMPFFAFLLLVSGALL